jgi:FkbM family methyltransferase
MIEATTFEEQIYASVVRAGDVCFDIGANRGDVSLFLARLVGASGMVAAFEPVASMYDVLCRSVEASGMPIITVPLGLSDGELAGTIHVPNGEFEMGSMAAPEAWSDAQSGAELSKHRAHFVTLDSFMAKNALPDPQFMKVDVEGAELLVLRGAEGLFARGVRPMMVLEVFAPWERAFGYGPWELLRPLQLRGYSFEFACPDGLVPHVPSNDEPFPARFKWGYNVLAYHPIEHARRVSSLDDLRKDVLSMPPPPRANEIV